MRIGCINKSDRFNPWERIDFVGGVNPNGTRWKLSQSEAIAGMEGNRWSFYVERPAGDRVPVLVTLSAHGHKYLKTRADGDQPNNLPSLPECP